MSKQFDVVVIGGGPGGYIAAIRAAQLGFNVACIDEWKNAAGGPAPGGTCTNVGCIPSKALLQSSEHFEHATHHFAEHGISTGTVKMDVAKMMARKDTVVKQNNDGILYLFKKNKVSFFHGRGSFAGPRTAPTRSRWPALPKRCWWPSRSSSPPAPTPASCRAPSSTRT
jgi:dihydrolipoamide dehydrogenase